MCGGPHDVVNCVCVRVHRKVVGQRGATPPPPRAPAPRPPGPPANLPPCHPATLPPCHPAPYQSEPILHAHYCCTRAAKDKTWLDMKRRSMLAQVAHRLAGGGEAGSAPVVVVGGGWLGSRATKNAKFTPVIQVRNVSRGHPAFKLVAPAPRCVPMPCPTCPGPPPPPPHTHTPSPRSTLPADIPPPYSCSRSPPPPPPPPAWSVPVEQNVQLLREADAADRRTRVPLRPLRRVRQPVSVRASGGSGPRPMHTTRDDTTQSHGDPACALGGGGGEGLACVGLQCVRAPRGTRARPQESVPLRPRAHLPCRDLNGARNILKVFQQYVKDGTRPGYLKRPGKGGATPGSGHGTSAGTAEVPASTSAAPGQGECVDRVGGVSVCGGGEEPTSVGGVWSVGRSGGGR